MATNAPSELYGFDVYQDCQPHITLAAWLQKRLPFLQIGRSLFHSPIREAMNLRVENQAVFLFMDSSESYMHRPSCGGITRYYRLSVRVRSRRGKRSYETGLTLARMVADAFTSAYDNPKMLPDKICDLHIVGGAPNYVGRREDDQHYWAINLHVEVQIPLRTIFVGSASAPLVCDPLIFMELEECGRHAYRIGTYPIDADVGDFVYIAIPQEFGAPILEGFTLFCTQSLDSVPYDIYLMDQPAAGPTTIEVL